MQLLTTLTVCGLFALACSSSGSGDEKQPGSAGASGSGGASVGCLAANSAVLCQAGCNAAKVNDQSALLPKRQPNTVSRPLDVVGLVPIPPSDGTRSDVRKLMITFDGLGAPVKWVSVAEFNQLPKNSFSTVIVANSSWELVELDAQATQTLASLPGQGVDILWLGNGIDPTLAGLFGVTVAGDGPLQGTGIQSLRYTASGGDVVQSPVYGDEWFTEVALAGATALATFEPGGLPAATLSYPASDQGGATIMVPFGLVHYWGEDAGHDAWARAEILQDVLTRALSQGSVWLDPFPAKHRGTMLVRFEDLNPGGTRFNTHDDLWLDRFSRVREAFDAIGLPMNMGIVARYADPAKGEEFAWDAPSEGRKKLRTKIQEALEGGWSIIAHGYTHQYGTLDQDYTGIDWEFSDDASGHWEYLPYSQQLDRIEKARAEVERVFGVAPQVWETPHLDGNGDTYRAAADAGFQWMNEGDTQLYPNRWGIDNLVAGQLLNLPHTASFVPFSDPGSFVEVSSKSTFPRLMRLRAPFFFFYHGYLDAQEDAACSMAHCAEHCSLWRPTIQKFAEFWQGREKTQVSLAHADGSSALVATVTKPPSGGSVTVRMPNGTRPNQVLVDGKSVPFEEQRRRGVAFARVPVPMLASVQVVVGYDG